MNYNFSMKFLKGKEMFVTDFLSRNPDNDTESPNEIIPIAFLLKDATEEWDNEKPLTRKRRKIVNTHSCGKCDDSLFVMTRSMAKTQGAAVPKMYPLQGDHKLPEVSKVGIIQTQVQQNEQQQLKVPEEPKQVQEQVIQEKGIAQQPIVQQQAHPVQPLQNVQIAQNFPNVVNPAYTVQPIPIQPAQPIAQPSF